MDLTFEGGNADQRKLWRVGIENLLNLPLEAIPLTVVVQFVPPGDLPSTGTSTTFAETVWTYDARSGRIEVRNDAPGFGTDDSTLMQEALALGVVYSPQLHFHETAAHETGHAVLAAIPEKQRNEIAQMFGAKSAAPSIIYPASKEWKNRIGEGIAETFKEAFLPAAMRVFPNRTNHKISYSLYPRFRRLIREGLESLEAIHVVEETVASESQSSRLLKQSTQFSWDPSSLAWSSISSEEKPFPADAKTLALFGGELIDFSTIYGDKQLTNENWAEWHGYTLHRYIGLETSKANLEAQDKFFGDGQHQLKVTVTLDEIDVASGPAAAFADYFDANAFQRQWGYEPPEHPYPYEAGPPVGQIVHMSLEGDARLVWRDGEGALHFSDVTAYDPEGLNTFDCVQVKALSEAERQAKKITPATQWEEYWTFDGHPHSSEAVHNRVLHIDGIRPTPTCRLVGVLLHFVMPVEVLKLVYLNGESPHFFEPIEGHAMGWVYEGVHGGAVVEVEVPGYTNGETLPGGIPIEVPQPSLTPTTAQSGRQVINPPVSGHIA